MSKPNLTTVASVNAPAQLNVLKTAFYLQTDVYYLPKHDLITLGKITLNIKGLNLYGTFTLNKNLDLEFLILRASEFKRLLPL